MMERRSSLVTTAALVFVSSVFSFYAGAAGLLPRLSQYVPPLAPAAEQAAPAGAGVDVEKLVRVQQYIQQQFLDDVSTEKLTQGALKGMVEATGDKYSAYFSPTQYARFLEHFEPSFSGIGVMVETSPKTGLVTVVRPIKGSPGEKAGLKAGDAIVSVDGKDISKMPLDEAVTLIKGKAGTKVQLKVRREGLTDPIEVTITRATIAMPSIESRMLDQAAGVGYIQVVEFNKQIGDRVSKAITDLRKQGMTHLVLDLRQNPGGLLDEAVNVSSLFLPPKEPVVHIVYRHKEKETFTSKAKQAWNLPLVVLVDGGSASASEIVAGAIRDTGVGVLIGEKTFGKGSVQSFYDLPDKSGIKLTTARYLTSGGHSIHEKGIEPNVVVANPKKVTPGDPGDVQLEAALKYIVEMKR